MEQELIESPLLNSESHSPEAELMQKIESSHIMVVFFSIPDCLVCKDLQPKVRKLVNEYGHVGFLHINCEKLPRICGQHTVFTVPTIIVFQNGNEVKRFSYSIGILEIRNLLDRLTL